MQIIPHGGRTRLSGEEEVRKLDVHFAKAVYSCMQFIGCNSNAEPVGYI